MNPAYRLSKSRYTAGLQCHRLLWWRVHEPDAPELVPDPGTQAIFDQGTRIGALAHTYVPGGTLIDFPYDQFQKKVEATAAALAAKAPVIYEASFSADRVFVAVDILERVRGGFGLIEVKSSTSAKPEHLPDAAVQAHVLARSGLEVRSVEIMHLNRACAFPDLGDLFTRTDVTGEVAELLPGRAGAGARAAEDGGGAAARGADRAALLGPLRVPVPVALLGEGAGRPRQHALPHREEGVGAGGAGLQHHRQRCPRTWASARRPSASGAPCCPAR